MCDYEDITVSASISVKLKLLRAFDNVAKQKGLKRSTMVAKLMQRVVDKAKRQDNE